MRLKKLFVMTGGFQSTLSVRRATPLAVDESKEIGISIHALREESDGIHKK